MFAGWLLAHVSQENVEIVPFWRYGDAAAPIQGVCVIGRIQAASSHKAPNPVLRRFGEPVRGIECDYQRGSAAAAGFGLATGEFVVVNGKFFTADAATKVSRPVFVPARRIGQYREVREGFSYHGASLAYLTGN